MDIVSEVPLSDPTQRTTQEFVYDSSEGVNTTVQHHEVVVVPDSMVTHRYDNPKLSTNLYLAVIDNIFNVLKPVLTIPRESESESSRGILGLIQQGRVLPVFYGNFQYGAEGNRVSASFGSEKGCLPTGFYYQEKPNFAQQLEGSRGVSIGLLSLDDALRDMEVENQLLDSGFRACMTVCAYELDSDKLAQFIRNNWIHKGATTVEQLVRNLEIITTSGDKPALQIRVGSTLDRVITLSSLDQLTNEADRRRIRSMVATGQRLFLGDLRANIADDSIIEGIEVFVDRLDGQTPLSEAETRQYVESLANFFIEQARILLHLSEKDSKFLGMLHNFLNVKDLDYGFVQYDFDIAQDSHTMEPSTRDQQESILLFNINWFLQEYLYGLSGLGFITLDEDKQAQMIQDVMANKALSNTAQ